MERLTYDFCVGNKHCWQVKGADNLECREVCRNQGENGCTDCPIAKAFDRLAAYEDTGLEPEELEEKQNEAYDLGYQSCLNYKGLRWDEAEELQRYREIGSIDRLRELAQAEKKGRLVVLPCDVGDKLYDVTLGEVREKIVISLSMLLSKSVNHLVIHAENFRNAVTSYELQDIGKTFFLTREAAEAALKEREAEYDTGRTTIGNSRLLG